MLRREVSRLQDQIHGLESEKAELAVSASEANRPLLRWTEAFPLHPQPTSKGIPGFACVGKPFLFDSPWYMYSTVKHYF